MEKLQKALDEARSARQAALSKNSAKPQDGRHRATTNSARATRRTQGIGIASNAEQGQDVWSQLALFEPNPKHLQKNRILTLNAEAGSTPFDVLRTKVFLMMEQNGWKRLAITSPDKACGKTTIACNLALGLSRQRESRTILYDLDLRRPNVANLLGRKPEVGIRQLLTGDVSAQEQMLCMRGNLALAMNVKPAPDAAELLMAGRTSDILSEIQQDFDPDITIFDLPPMYAAEDTRGFLKNTDCVMIVARSEHTRTSQLDQCEREVAEQTNVLGVILNNCRHATADDQYYGDYE